MKLPKIQEEPTIEFNQHFNKVMDTIHNSMGMIYNTRTQKSYMVLGLEHIESRYGMFRCICIRFIMVDGKQFFYKTLSDMTYRNETAFYNDNTFITKEEIKRTSLTTVINKVKYHTTPQGNLVVR